MEKLPATIQEIEQLSNLPIKDRQRVLNTILNRKPPEQFIVKNNNIPDVSIGYVEFLLTKIFVDWYVEVISYQVIVNSVSVHIRLFYLDIDGKTYKHQDGVGASPIQMNANSNATDLSQVKSKGVQMALPSAKSLAIKDAADCIGTIFGKDLGRKKIANYENENNNNLKKIFEDENNQKSNN